MRTFVVTVMLISLAAIAAAENLESVLERTYKGAWVLTRTEVWSDCTGFFTNNDITGTRVSSRGNRRFEPVSWLASTSSASNQRIELYAVVDNACWYCREGPFTLLDERACKVRVADRAPREVVRAGDPPIHGFIETLTTFDSREAARHARSEPAKATLPARPLADARPLIGRSSRPTPAEIQAAALEEEPHRPTYRGQPDDLQACCIYPGCELVPAELLLPRLRVFPAAGTAPFAPRGTNDILAFQRGFKDGQALVFHLELTRRTRGCFHSSPLVNPTALSAFERETEAVTSSSNPGSVPIVAVPVAAGVSTSRSVGSHSVVVAAGVGDVEITGGADNDMLTARVELSPKRGSGAAQPPGGRRAELQVTAMGDTLTLRISPRDGDQLHERGLAPAGA